MLAPIFLKSKEEALPDIKNWLVCAFQEKKGYCVPKKDVFGAYADFCAAHHYESTTPASFGKFLKKIFPGVETRRLVRNDVQAMYYHNLTQTATGSSDQSSPAGSPTSTTPTPTSPSTSQLEREHSSSTHDAASPWQYYATSTSALPPSPTFRVFSSYSPPPAPAHTTCPAAYHFDASGLLPALPDALFRSEVQQDPFPAAGMSWEGLCYLHSLLAAATQPSATACTRPPVLRPKRETTRKAQKAGDRLTTDHSPKRKREEHRRDDDRGSGDTRWTESRQTSNGNTSLTNTRRTKARLDYILN